MLGAGHGAGHSVSGGSFPSHYASEVGAKAGASHDGGHHPWASGRGGPVQQVKFSKNGHKSISSSTHSLRTLPLSAKRESVSSPLELKVGAEHGRLSAHITWSTSGQMNLGEPLPGAA